MTKIAKRATRNCNGDDAIKEAAREAANDRMTTSPLDRLGLNVKADAYFNFAGCDDIDEIINIEIPYIGTSLDEMKSFSATKYRNSKSACHRLLISIRPFGSSFAPQLTASRSQLLKFTRPNPWERFRKYWEIHSKIV